MGKLGLINKIIPFSAVDGFGCRTAVFLQGCNFNCQYCHNPETISRCINCGICIEKCPAGAIWLEDGVVQYNEDICMQCDSCIKICPHNSTPKTMQYTAKELAALILRNVPFIRGVTFSGGEGTLQKEFLEEIIPILKENRLEVLLDSNGNFSFLEYEAIINQVEGVMLDIKAFPLQEHIRVTSKENDEVLKNAVFLAERGKLSEVRTVVVPQLFDVKKTIEETARLLKPYHCIHEISYRLISYRSFGVRRQYAVYDAPSRVQMEELKEILAGYGFTNVIIT